MPEAPSLTLDRSAPAVMTRAATFRPASFREADNSMEVCWSTGAAGLRFDWYDGGYYIEELSMDPAAVRLDRLNAGACLLDSHRAGSLAAVLGSIVPGTARVAKGEGTARVRLASTPDVADINAKIIDGHIRNLSVSYHVYEFQRTERSGDEHPHMLATDWEPTEISMVAVPFDAAAQIRSEGSTMPNIIETNADDRRDDNRDHRRERARESGQAVYRNGSPSRTRSVTEDQILRAAARADLPRDQERELIEDNEDHPLSEADLYRRVSDYLITSRSRDPISAGAPRSPERGSPGQLHERMTDALFARLSHTAPTEQAREFMSASMVDMARGIMEARGERVRWASPGAVVDQMARGGSLTTSDFPQILGNAMQRHLGALIARSPSPLRAIARQRLANDFRRMAVLTLGSNPSLLVVKENGEIKHGSVSESGEGYQLSTYARIVSLTRQMLINDDLAAFARIFEGWALSANDLEANILKSQIEGNGLVMADGKTLYHADHGNVAGAGAAITVASLTAGRMAMRMQKDMDGGGPLNIAPKYLVVGAAQETAAQQLLAQLAASTPGGVNPFAGNLDLIVDARLTGFSWRLFADPVQWTVLEEARLAGQEDVFVDTHTSFEVDGIKTKARLDIAAAAVDWRGTYLNPGAAPA